MSALGFKARVDFMLACFLACMLFLRFTSGVTCADLLMASMAARPFLPIYCSCQMYPASIGGAGAWAMA